MGWGVEYNNGTGTNVHIAAHQRSLHHGALANKHVVPKLHRVKAKCTVFLKSDQLTQVSRGREGGREAEGYSTPDWSCLAA